MDRLKSFLTKFGCGMEERIQEAAKLKERCELNQEKINNLDMITLDELIGFPIPKEHREELWKRLCSYSAMTKKELMSLLLQYDWELLQLKLQTQEDMHKIFSQKSSMPVGDMIEAAIKATYSAKAIAEMKRDNADYIDKVCDILRELTDDRLGDKFMDDFRKRLEEQ